MKRVLLATRNRNKLREIREVFADVKVEFLTVDDLPELPDVIEDRDTFRGNAEKKALEAAAASGLRALADDSGLEVDALDGRPGVQSARYAGSHGDDRANLEKVLAEMNGVEDRAARFRCAIALAEPTGEVQSVEGVCEGSIARESAGDGGFGYDPIFTPDGHARTFAQLEPESKHRISHRGNALRAAARAWSSLFDGS
jgi:XTP/dITP diphosphohydrolase